MKFSSSILVPIALAGFAAAIPSYVRRDTNSTGATTVPNDEPAESDTTLTQTQTLQYALTLEHLESTFYQRYLAEFTEEDFTNAGFPSWVRGRIAQIGEHEQIHVAFLTAALGNDSVAACNYSFPVTDPKSFVMVSRALETVGTSAYLGAAHFLSDPEVATAAGTIVTTEARHAGWLESSVYEEQPWSGPFDVPLDFNQVFTLASQFITSCPTTNPTLPLKAFPALTAVGTPEAGQNATFSFNATVPGNSTTFLAIFSGLNATFVPLDFTSTSNGTLNGTTQASAFIPEDIQGTAFAVITTNDTVVNDNNTIAGPAILNFPFGPDVSNA